MYFRIKEARKTAKLTQCELAEKLGIKVSTLSGYEIGAHDPKSNTLAQIAQICGVTVDYLLGVEPTAYDKLQTALGPDSPTRQALYSIGKQLSPDTFADPNRAELLDIYDVMNDRGRQTLLDVARGLAANPDMKKDGTSKNGTA